ncbi:hypothetical protein [Parasitella parasitica]|uniref:Uncharacterized protein n=1 Tax=Parasitella parasitica TaxID=35722 RepID=A0A0B7NIN2_9FUNG|nr:hypothetical protein [Parasitella parasitica]
MGLDKLDEATKAFQTGLLYIGPDDKGLVGAIRECSAAAKNALIQYGEDSVSVDDVIDLNQDYSGNDGRSSSQNHYRISLQSIDDDELRIFRRGLVTPAPSVFGDDTDIIKKNMIRNRFVAPSRIQRPVSRGESVMLFKKINNGDEDVAFDDLVSSELKDFIDTDFMMDGMLSRPVSRTTIDKNASKIRDITRYRSSVSTHNEHKQQLKNQRTMLPSKLRSLSISGSSTKEALQAQEKSRNQQRNLSSVVPESQPIQSNHRQFHQHRTLVATAAAPASSRRDDYLHKQIPKKPVTMIPSSRDRHTLKSVIAASQPHKLAHSYPTSPPAPVPVPVSTKRQVINANQSTQNYGRKLPEPVVDAHPPTPRFMPRKFSIPQRNTHDDYVGRTRSDTTTTTTSSSSEDEPKEEAYQHQFATTASYHRSYSSQPLTFDHYNNNAPLFHRYNKTTEYIKPLSSPRLRTMSSHKTFPTSTIANHSNHSTATATSRNTTTTTINDTDVIDSAKQVLASIRERRMRSMMNNGPL